MSFNSGNKLKFVCFGQSHSEAMGVIAEGFPAGFKPDIKRLSDFMKRRAPGRDEFSTQRKETDEPIFLSGLNADGSFCGSPVCIMIKNSDARSADYENIKLVPRPGHSDFAAYMKYKGFNDIRGGGQFSGRLTAPICAAGGIALQILEEKGVFIGSHIYSLHGIRDDDFDYIAPDERLFKEIADKGFPVISSEKGEKMQKKISEAREKGDSVGGIIECMITGLNAGVGDFGTDSIESRISSVVFSIPAVKGIEFGNGFECEKLCGSENNDEFYADENGNIKTRTNNHGGILGGISSGMPIVFRAAVKPTPSIAREQKSVNLRTGKEQSLKINGRHDPCIVQRAVPVFEAVCALVVLDLLS